MLETYRQTDRMKLLVSCNLAYDQALSTAGQKNKMYTDMSKILTSSLHEQTCFSSNDECQSSWEDTLKQLQCSADSLLQQRTNADGQRSRGWCHRPLRRRHNPSHRAVEVGNPDVNGRCVYLQLVTTLVDLRISATEGTQRSLRAQRL